MGRILFFIGVTGPFRVVWEYDSESLFGLGSRFGASAAVDLAVHLALAFLSAWAGWGILRRRDWAPSAVCCGAGATLVDAGYYLRGDGPPAVRLLLRTLNTEYLHVGLRIVAPVLLEAVIVGCWLVTLGAVLRRTGREEFVSPGSGLPVSSLWASLVLSALTCGALRAIAAAFFWVQMPSGVR
jgi:hypothetical protein